MYRAFGETEKDGLDRDFGRLNASAPMLKFNVVPNSKPTGGLRSSEPGAVNEDKDASDNWLASFSGRTDKMRISTLCMLSAMLAVPVLSSNQVVAATLTVHTPPPKVNVHLPPPKVRVHSSPVAVTHVTNGTHFKTGTMIVRHDGGSKTAYGKKTSQPKGQSADKPSESLSINFTKIEHHY